MQRPETEITFLGTASCVPTAGHDTASFVINGIYLVDNGWYSAIKMLSYGINPTNIETVFISHCHHDHYIGLAHVLFYLAMRRGERPERPPIKIVGPESDIQRVVDLTRAFLQIGRFPEVHVEHEVLAIRPGESIEIGDFRVDTCATVHPVQGLCYKFTNKATGASFAYTGDTAYHPPISDHVRGVSLLIHEASHGPNQAEETRYGHSGAPDAARIAKMANVKRLALVHYPEPQAHQTLESAQKIFTNTFLPEEGQVVEIIG